MEKIGPGNCSRYFLTGEQFDAQEAVRIGLVQHSFPSMEELDKSLDKILQSFEKETGPKAVKAAKRLIAHVSRQRNVEEVRNYVAREIAEIRVGEEGQEGLQSFFDKRPAKWTV